MAKIPLVYYPDNVLTTRSADVTEIDQEVVDFVQAMRETMYASNGVGLAAPQVGRNLRIMTIDVEPDEGGKHFRHFINPVIVDGFGRTTWEEGCLSFPGLVIEVKRRKQVHLQAYDLDGGLIDLEADGLLAICIQHELDHLNGVVMVDRLNPVQKTIVVRDYLRRREDQKDDDRIDRIVALHAGRPGGAGPPGLVESGQPGFAGPSGLVESGQPGFAGPSGLVESGQPGFAGPSGLVDAQGQPITLGEAREQDEAVVVQSHGRPVAGS